MIGHHFRRRNTGQGIVEGTVGIILIIGVFIAVFVGSVDVYFYAANSEKLKMAAQAAARVYAQQRTLYNAMILPESEEPRARANAEAVANYVLDKMGVPAGRTVTVSQETIDGALISHADVSVNFLLPFSRVTNLPGNISVSAYDAIGFGKARVARITVPNYLGNRDTELTMANFCNNRPHLCINFPIFEYDEQVISSGPTPPNLSYTDPGHQLDWGPLPSGYNNNYFPGFNLLGAGYQPGRAQLPGGG